MRAFAEPRVSMAMSKGRCQFAAILLLATVSLNVAAEEVTLNVASEPAVGVIETSGFCSPVQTGQGDMELTCEGVPPEIVQDLLDTYVRQGEELAKAIARIEDYAESYAELAERYAELVLALGEGRLLQTREALAEGDLQAAADLIASTEEELRMSQADFRRAAIELLDALAAGGREFGGVANATKTWPPGHKATVCFFGGDRPTRHSVARIASEWSLYGNFSFDFGLLPELRTCSEEETTDIRISFDRGGNWSYVGTDSRRIPRDQPTMNLEAPESIAATWKGTVLHEFGHALALLHMLQHPSACQEEFDWGHIDQLAAELGWTREMVQRSLGPYDAGPNLNVGEFDATSVMMYHLPAEYFLRGDASHCFGRGGQELSIADKLAMYVMYPFSSESPT